jgi:hypothetical protein
MAVRFLYSEYTFQRVLVLRRTRSHYYPHKNFPRAWRRGANQYFSSERVLIMTGKIKYRPIEPEDGPGLDALISYNPSSGSISFSYDYQADILEVNKAFANDLHGIVATIDSTIIAMVFGDRLEVQWEGEIYPAAYISNMRVQSEHRRKHIARGMSEYGIQYAEDILGSDSVYYSAPRCRRVTSAWVYPKHSNSPPRAQYRAALCPCAVLHPRIYLTLLSGKQIARTFLKLRRG